MIDMYVYIYIYIHTDIIDDIDDIDDLHIQNGDVP